MKSKMKESVVSYTFLLLGCLLLAFAISSILKPNGLIAGGLTGASILISKLVQVNYTYIYWLLAVSVLFWAWYVLGKKEAMKIVFFSVCFPMMLITFDSLQFAFIADDIMLATIYYGILGGVGSGLILKEGFSQGGNDTVAKILQKKHFPFVKLSQLMLMIDATVIISSLLVFDTNVALYAIVARVIFVKSIDMVLFGFDSQKVRVAVISDSASAIEDFIIAEIKRGVTSSQVTGGYTRKTKRKLISICSPRESIQLKRHIAKIDPYAFISVSPVMTVWGNGNGFDSLTDDE